jgi:hypothetical protein
MQRIWLLDRPRAASGYGTCAARDCRVIPIGGTLRTNPKSTVSRAVLLCAMSLNPFYRTHRAGPIGTNNPQTDWPFRSRLLAIIRPTRRQHRPTSTPAFLLSRRNRPSLGPRNIQEPRRLQGPYRPCLGRRMGSSRRVLCNGESGSDGEVVGDGSGDAAAHVCGSLVGC